MQNQMPDSWDDYTDNDSDEYGDTYTNLSSVSFNDPGLSMSADADTISNYSQRLLSIVHAAWKTNLNTGQVIPSHLQHMSRMVPPGAVETVLLPSMMVNLLLTSVATIQQPCPRTSRVAAVPSQEDDVHA